MLLLHLIIPNDKLLQGSCRASNLDSQQTLQSTDHNWKESNNLLPSVACANIGRIRNACKLSDHVDSFSSSTSKQGVLTFKPCTVRIFSGSQDFRKLDL